MIQRIIRFFYINFLNPTYVFRNSVKQAYISYLSEPFYRKTDISYLNKHQNRKEAIKIGDFFINNGFSIRVERFDKILVWKKHPFELIFGVEPNFLRISNVNPNAIKIYYATGAYYKHQNEMIIKRTDNVNALHKLTLSYQRLVKPHDSCEKADYIIQIGTPTTIKTYPESLRNKIFLVRQTCHNYNYNIDLKLLNYNRNTYMWMGSIGSVLKGLDLVLDFFSQNSQYELHVIGTIDDDFQKAYYSILHNSSNILYHGFLPIDSDELISVAEKCVAIIFPSCSEGAPGSVINMNKLGLIPIVSQWCAYDEINDLGYVLPELDVASISQSVKWINGLSKEVIKELFIKNYRYANANFNEEIFESDFISALTTILNAKNHF